MQLPKLNLTTLKIVLVAAFGGMSPKLIELVPRLFRNEFPSGGYYWGLALLAVFGIVAVLVYNEQDLKKVLAMAAGAPAIIASLASATVAPTEAAMINPPSLDILAVAYAQTPLSLREMTRLSLMVEKNESPFQINALWIRAGKTTLHYSVDGNKILVDIPSGAEQLRLDFPADTTGLTLNVSGVDRTKPILIRISGSGSTRDFWQAFGGAKVPRFRIERVQPEVMR